MQSPRGQPKTGSAISGKQLSPNSRRQLAFKSKKLSDLRSVSPNSKREGSPFSKHQKSFSSLYSKFMQQKTYEGNHELGYSADQIKQAVNFIFQKYDTNHDNLLDRQQVKKLIQNSLLHMGQNHEPSELEIIEFIYSMDKNNDGKLSRAELQNAFKRANRIDY